MKFNVIRIFILTILFILFTAHTQASNNGISDQDLNLTDGTKQGQPSGPGQCGTGCHTTALAGASITIAASPAGPYEPGQGDIILKTVDYKTYILLKIFGLFMGTSGVYND